MDVPLKETSISIEGQTVMVYQGIDHHLLPSRRAGISCEIYCLPLEGFSDFASGSPLISNARVTLSATIVQIAPDIR